MDGYSKYRTAGYAATILVQVGNIISIAKPPPKELADDIIYQNFNEMRARFLTVWTITLQLVYAFTGLLCEYLESKNTGKGNYKLLSILKNFRDTLFACFVVPSTMVVFVFFWPLFIYDRSIIFPEFLDLVLGTAANHIMHTFILPTIIWEILFRPRKTPESHFTNFKYVTFYFALYFCVMTYTYIERGIWIYPVITNSYGTIYFPIACGYCYGSGVLYYFLQWFIPSIASIPTEKAKPKRKIR